ncbi:MAG: (d)CMP kinase [Thermoguttaceae bacterium]|jgi:cytidylate kinase
MIVTIDGPAGAGKSTVARALARRLGFRYLDTGAMYRAVALAGLRRNVNWQRPEEVVRLARQLKIEVRDERLLLDGEDVTDLVRSSEVTTVTRFAADNPEVRAHLVELQRQVADQQNVITEGRDQGTVVFPNAECKVFLTASPEVRAERRVADFHVRGETRGFDDVLGEINRRDNRDASRTVGPLVQAPGAIEVLTDGLAIEQVVDRLETIVRQCQAGQRPRGHHCKQGPVQK